MTSRPTLVSSVGEDRVMGDERNAEPDGGRRHPAVGLMLLLPEAVSVLDAPGAEFGVALDQRLAWPDDLGSGDLLVKLV